jgi:hypothetical protein
MLIYILYVHTYTMNSRLLMLIKEKDKQTVEKMDVSIESHFSYSSYTCRLCCAYHSAQELTNSDWLLLQNTHLEDGQASATHVSLLFPFLLAPTEMAVISPFDHGNG